MTRTSTSDELGQTMVAQIKLGLANGSRAAAVSAVRREQQRPAVKR